MFGKENRRAAISLASPDTSWIESITDLNKQLDRLYKAIAGQGKLQAQQHADWNAEMTLRQDEILQMRLKISSINKALEESMDANVAKNREIRILRELGGRRASDR